MQERLQIAQMLFAQRILKKKTQTKCGNALGVTFQQFQKYEKADNGIPSTKLLLFCKKFGVKLSEFQDGDPYSVIEGAEIHPLKKEECFERLNELELKLNRKEQSDDKSRSEENMAGQSIS